MKIPRFLLPTLAVGALSLGSAAPAIAHCDTLDGPVITDARAAIAAGQPDAVLKWIPASDEAEIRAAFAQALAVRRLSPQAAALADRWFFENLVRIHRASEGAPYDGLKETAPPMPVVEAADAALTSGDLQPLLDSTARHISAELERRFVRLREAAGHKDHNPEAGRDYVKAYVDFVHYAEAVVGAGSHDTPGTSPQHQH